MFELTFTSHVLSSTQVFETYSEALDALALLLEAPDDVGGRKQTAKYRSVEQNIEIRGPYSTLYELKRRPEERLTKKETMQEKFFVASAFQLEDRSGCLFLSKMDRTVLEGPFTSECSAQKRAKDLSKTKGTTGVFVHTKDGLLFLYDQEQIHN